MKRILLLLSALLSLGAWAQIDSIAQGDTLQRLRPEPTRFAMVNGSRPWMGRSYWMNPMNYGVLHEGFNANLSLSATVGFGKHAPSGVGFGKSIDLSYLHTFSPKLSAAVGVYASHFSWGGSSNTDLGVTAMLAYRATDRLTLYAYGTKSLTPNSRNTWQYGYWNNFLSTGDRLGVAAGYKFSEKFHMQLNFEMVREHHPVYYNGVMRSGLQPYEPFGW